MKNKKKFVKNECIKKEEDIYNHWQLKKDKDLDLDKVIPYRKTEFGYSRRLSRGFNMLSDDYEE